MTLKATLKPDTNSENFLFAHLKQFMKLKNLHLTITDGFTCFDGPNPKITELKLFFQLTCQYNFILKNIISKCQALESSTICEGTFSYNDTSFSEGSKLTRLSIKNPYFDELEEDNFLRSLCSYNLTVLKFIVTHIPNAAAHIRATSIISQYMKEAPHSNLKELSITMPNDNLNTDYQAFVKKLLKLKYLRLFISASLQNNDVRKLIPFFKEVRSNLKITLCYYKFEDKIPRIAEDRLLLNEFENIRIIELRNPYITYKQRLEPNQRFLK